MFQRRNAWNRAYRGTTNYHRYQMYTASVHTFPYSSFTPDAIESEYYVSFDSLYTTFPQDGVAGYGSVGRVALSHYEEYRVVNCQVTIRSPFNPETDNAIRPYWDVVGQEVLYSSGAALGQAQVFIQTPKTLDIGPEGTDNWASLFSALQRNPRLRGFSFPDNGVLTFNFKPKVVEFVADSAAQPTFDAEGYKLVDAPWVSTQNPNLWLEATGDAIRYYLTDIMFRFRHPGLGDTIPTSLTNVLRFTLDYRFDVECRLVRLVYEITGTPFTETEEEGGDVILPIGGVPVADGTGLGTTVLPWRKRLRVDTSGDRRRAAEGRTALLPASEEDRGSPVVGVSGEL